jgi:hypothetical protein
MWISVEVKKDLLGLEAPAEEVELNSPRSINIQNFLPILDQGKRESNDKNYRENDDGGQKGITLAVLELKHDDHCKEKQVGDQIDEPENIVKVTCKCLSHPHQEAVFFGNYASQTLGYFFVEVLLLRVPHNHSDDAPVVFGGH